MLTVEGIQFEEKLQRNIGNIAKQIYFAVALETVSRLSVVDY